MSQRLLITTKKTNRHGIYDCIIEESTPLDKIKEKLTDEWEYYNLPIKVHIENIPLYLKIEKYLIDLMSDSYPVEIWIFSKKGSSVEIEHPETIQEVHDWLEGKYENLGCISSNKVTLERNTEEAKIIPLPEEVAKSMNADLDFRKAYELFSKKNRCINLDNLISG